MAETRKPSIRTAPAGPSDRETVIDVDATIAGDKDVARGFETRTAVLEAADAIEYWMKNARRPDAGIGFTQAELADRLGVKQSRISHLINADKGHGPSYALMKRMCLACGFAWPSGLAEAMTAAHGQALTPEPEVDAGVLRTPPQAYGVGVGINPETGQFGHWVGQDLAAWSQDNVQQASRLAELIVMLNETEMGGHGDPAYNTQRMALRRAASGHLFALETLVEKVKAAAAKPDWGAGVAINPAVRKEPKR